MAQEQYRAQQEHQMKFLMMQQEAAIKQYQELFQDLARPSAETVKVKDLIVTYKDGEDIQAFLLNFQRVMENEEVDERNGLNIY